MDSEFMVTYVMVGCIMDMKGGETNDEEMFELLHTVKGYRDLEMPAVAGTIDKNIRLLLVMAR